MSAFGSDDKNYGINEIDQSPKVEQNDTNTYEETNDQLR